MYAAAGRISVPDLGISWPLQLRTTSTRNLKNPADALTLFASGTPVLHNSFGDAIRAKRGRSRVPVMGGVGVPRRVHADPLMVPHRERRVVRSWRSLGGVAGVPRAVPVLPREPARGVVAGRRSVCR